FDTTETHQSVLERTSRVLGMHLATDLLHEGENLWIPHGFLVLPFHTDSSAMRGNGEGVGGTELRIDGAADVGVLQVRLLAVLRAENPDCFDVPGRQSMLFDQFVEEIETGMEYPAARVRFVLLFGEQPVVVDALKHLLRLPFVGTRETPE